MEDHETRERLDEIFEIMKKNYEENLRIDEMLRSLSENLGTNLSPRPKRRLRDFSVSARTLGVVLPNYQDVSESPENFRCKFYPLHKNKFTIAVRGYMDDTQNHNFWFSSRRYYVFEKKWNRISPTKFFSQFKIRIGRFYWKTVMRYLCRHNVNQETLNYANALLEGIVAKVTNEHLLLMLEPYRENLRKQWNNRNIS